MRKLLLSVLLLNLLPLDACIPFINNYGRDDYGSGNVTWRIASYGKWSFFANEKGLLVYDGVSWAKYPLNNRGEARGVAVFPDRHRVYVGGENEYGYFEVDAASGELRYNCMSDSVDEQFRQVGNVWEFYELTNVLCLRCDDHILTIAGDKLDFIRSDEKIFASVLVDGVIYVATDHGVKMVAGERLLPIMNAEILEGKRINGMFKYGQCMIVTTANDGLFYYDGRTVVPFPTSADAMLKHGVISCAAVRDDVAALGTVLYGLVTLNLKTGEVRVFDERSGLQNNTILGVGFDQDGNVWVGMDYGIDLVLLDAPFAYLYKGTQSYGIGYCSQTIDGRLYLGTDRGLYAMPYADAVSDGMAEITKLDCPSGPAWCLYRNGDELFCLHDKGIFTISGTTVTKVTDIIGAWSCQAVEGHPDMMFVGVYSGVYLLKKQNGQWTSLGRIEGIGESGRYLRQTAEHQLTIYNPNIGTANVYQLSATLLKAVSQQAIKAQWHDGSSEELLMLFDEWNISGPITALSENRSLIPCSRGFVVFNKEKTHHRIEVAIRRMQTTSPSDSLVYASNFCNLRPEPVLSYANNSVRFDFRVQSSQIESAVRYQYRLNGGEWSPLSEQTTKEYSNLHEGKYTFEVRSEMHDGQQSTDSITFRILPPWYRTWQAYVCYALLFVGGMALLFRMERCRIRRKEEEAVAEKNIEVGRLKVEIDQLEKDKLDLELKHKSQEIANLMVNVARKNEILTGLKEQIRMVALKLSKDNTADCKRELLLINNSIQSNMEGDEVLRRFEEQFDLVNDNFIRRISAKHPDLSNSERLMCAYLKMNLSTKEIAPLLNISVRGVETMRYRIRKKFGLERDDNLMEYLSTFYGPVGELPAESPAEKAE